MKKGTKVDILSTWIYRRGLNTLTCCNTHALHKTLALCIMKPGLIRTDTRLQQRFLQKESNAPKICPSLLSAPTIVGYQEAFMAILQAIHTNRKRDMVLAALPKRPHQDSYEVVATPITATFHCVEDMSFPTVRTDYNGPLLHSHCYIVGAVHDYDQLVL